MKNVKRVNDRGEGGREHRDGRGEGVQRNRAPKVQKKDGLIRIMMFLPENFSFI